MTYWKPARAESLGLITNYRCTGFCSGLRLDEEAARAIPDLFEKGLELRRYPALEMLLGDGLQSLYLNAAAGV
jgi:hypothetical protein